MHSCEVSVGSSARTTRPQAVGACPSGVCRGTVVGAVGDHHRPDLNHRDLSTVVAAATDLADVDGDGHVRDRLDLGTAKLEQLRRELAHQAEEIGALLRGDASS